MKKSILLVEDEENLAKAILLNLELENYSVHHLKNGNTAINHLKEAYANYDLVILDVMLPEKDGLEVCKFLRNSKITLPVLFLSARNTPEDKVLGLKAGADDYLGKPFNLEEFLLRIQILLQRSKKEELTKREEYLFKNGKIFFEKMKALDFDGNEIDLTKREADLLWYLTQNEGKAVSRGDILGSVWKKEEASERTIDNLIVKFRKLFEPDPKKPIHFISLRSIGYKFES